MARIHRGGSAQMSLPRDPHVPAAGDGRLGGQPVLSGGGADGLLAAVRRGVPLPDSAAGITGAAVRGRAGARPQGVGDRVTVPGPGAAEETGEPEEDTAPVVPAAGRGREEVLLEADRPVQDAAVAAGSRADGRQDLPRTLAGRPPSAAATFFSLLPLGLPRAGGRVGHARCRLAGRTRLRARGCCRAPWVVTTSRRSRRRSSSAPPPPSSRRPSRRRCRPVRRPRPSCRGRRACRRRRRRRARRPR